MIFHHAQNSLYIMRFTTCIQLLFLSVLFVQCNPGNEPATICENGYEFNGAECVCPEDKREAFGFCKGLEPGELFGRPADCVCDDGIFFKLQAKVGSGYVKDAYFTVMDDRGITVNSTMKCIELPDGDSLFGHFPLHCAIDNEPFRAVVRAKFVAPDSLRMDLLQVHFSSDSPSQIAFVKDSCRFWLTRD
jgi:hypothetical protein